MTEAEPAKRGRPMKYGTTEELKEAITKYFDSCFEVVWVDKQIRDDEGNWLEEEVDGKMKKIVRPVKHLAMVEVPTVSGMAVALGTTRRTLLDYEDEKHNNPPDFAHTIKDAKQRIEAYAEQKLFGGAQVAGVIFNLKNNFKWSDKQEMDLKVNNIGSLLDRLAGRKSD